MKLTVKLYGHSLLPSREQYLYWQAKEVVFFDIQSTLSSDKAGRDKVYKEIKVSIRMQQRCHNIKGRLKDEKAEIKKNNKLINTYPVMTCFTFIILGSAFIHNFSSTFTLLFLDN